MRYPVVAIDNSMDLYFARDEKDLLETNNLAIKNGYFKNLKTIDSDGVVRILKDAIKTSYATPFLGFNIYLEQRFKIKFIINKQYEISLNDVKTTLVDAMKKDSYFWDSGGNFNELITSINKLNSVEDILLLLTKSFYEESR